MKAIFQIDKPEKVQATMSITMTIEEWEKLRDQLTQSFPSWWLGEAIRDILVKAKEVFFTDGHKE